MPVTADIFLQTCFESELDSSIDEIESSESPPASDQRGHPVHLRRLLHLAGGHRHHLLCPQLRPEQRQDEVLTDALDRFD